MLKIEYVPTNKMLADGLTKALQNNRFKQFRNIIRLNNISSTIAQQRLKELRLEDLQID